MLFEKIKKRINAKKVIKDDWVYFFFRGRVKKYFPDADKLLAVKTEIIRNFRGKFRNLSLRYTLTYLKKDNRKKQGVLRAKINTLHLNPKRHYLTLCFLKEQGFGKYISDPVDYIADLNLFLYKELKGECFQDFLSTHKNLNLLLSATPKISNFIYRVHSLPVKPSPKFRVAEKDFEKSCRYHWSFLVRKCAPAFFPKMRALLDEVWKQRSKKNITYKKPLSLIHGDFHWGNIILVTKNRVGFLDFGDSKLSDPFVDLASFIVQTESMFRYYCPNKDKLKQAIIKKFLQNYFKRDLTKQEQAKLLYFEANQYLQIAAVHAFIEPNPVYKKQGLETLLGAAEKKIDLLKSL